MKKIYCDICGGLIPCDAVSNRLILPVWNKVLRSTVMSEYPDVCESCTEEIAVYVDQMLRLSRLPVDPSLPESDDSPAPEWHPVSEPPSSDGRYLVADTRLTVSGRPHVSIAMYSRDEDEWATNALIHPEDIICWTDIPETPDRFFKEKDLIEEDDER